MKTKILSIVFIILIYANGYSQHLAVKTNSSPKIDGVIEDLWMNSTRFESFKQIAPNILAEPTVKSEGYFFYDEDNIYMAMKLYQRKNTIHSNRGRKDSELVSEGDIALFAIDPMNNRNTAYFFVVNATNAVEDGTLSEDGTKSKDWDGIFYSAVNISDDYWSVEIQVPLNTIGFQNKEIQNWGISFFRYYAQNQEQIVSRLSDIHNPYRLTNFDTVNDLVGLKKSNNFRLLPYLYSTNENNFLLNNSKYRGKLGGELIYTPNPSLQILATFNPDYAQLETDKEVINVSDLPTEYPEKRPFFTESSDFYPGAAVNTRNIVDIQAGLKVKQLSELLKYDVTGVLDGENNKWLLSNIKLTDNVSYLAEIIGGLKNHESTNNYNVTTHVIAWLFDKRLSIYNWFGTINNPIRDKNEFETVNAIKWKSRNWDTGIWSHYRSKYYNPNIVGWNYLSNLVIYKTWLNYSIINESGFFRNNTFGITAFYNDLTSPQSNSYFTFDIVSNNLFHPSELLGNWSFQITFTPKSNQQFRYRKVENYNDNMIFEDAISKFVLIEDAANTVAVDLQSDYSKNFGGRLNYNNYHVRASKANNLETEVYWKLGSSSIIKYSLSYINIEGSPYQDKYEQVIHRLQIEYNITDKLNIRGIIQPNTSRLPNQNEYENRIQAFNVTLSWEYMPGSFLYFVYNKYEDSEKEALQSRALLVNNQSFIIKLNKSLSF